MNCNKRSVMQFRQTFLVPISLVVAGLLLTGCQSNQVSKTQQNTVNLVSQDTIKKFSIHGKIGVTTPEQTSSAFYSWSQEDKRFGIDLSGALGIGRTIIEYNGQTATLVSEKTGTITADNPEELLFKATKWQAPISQLPYWILGQSAPSDELNEKDEQNRLSSANNAGWTAVFHYANNQDNLPNKIVMRHQAGYRVILTINHFS